jgi:hypothetical protein
MAPSSLKATTEGVVRAPSAFSITCFGFRGQDVVAVKSCRGTSLIRNYRGTSLVSNYMGISLMRWLTGLYRKPKTVNLSRSSERESLLKP